MKPLLALVMGSTCLALAGPPAVKPNIVFVLTDQWRASAFGFAGDPNVKTPHLDKLAARSVRLHQRGLGLSGLHALPGGAAHRAGFRPRPGCSSTISTCRTRSYAWAKSSRRPATTPPISASGTSTAMAASPTSRLNAGRGSIIGRRRSATTTTTTRIITPARHP